MDNEFPMTFAETRGQYGRYEVARFETTYPDGSVVIEYQIGEYPVLRRLDDLDFREYRT